MYSPDAVLVIGNRRATVYLYILCQKFCYTSTTWNISRERECTCDLDVDFNTV